MGPIKSISFRRRRVADYAARVASYSRGDLASALRSTVPLLAYCRDTGRAVTRLG
jgi:hypothetical protein